MFGFACLYWYRNNFAIGLHRGSAASSSGTSIQDVGESVASGFFFLVAIAFGVELGRGRLAAANRSSGLDSTTCGVSSPSTAIAESSVVVDIAEAALCSNCMTKPRPAPAAAASIAGSKPGGPAADPLVDSVCDGPESLLPPPRLLPWPVPSLAPLLPLPRPWPSL